MIPPVRLLILTGFFLIASIAAGEDKIYLEASKTEELVAKEGQKIVVYGETEGSNKSASGTNFVRFKGAGFFLVTFKSDLKQFEEGEPHALYEGKRVAVEGAISIYQGKPQIKLTEPDQITVLAPDAVFPPPVTPADTPESAGPKMKAEKTGTPTTPAPEEPKRKPPVDPAEYFKK